MAERLSCLLPRLMSEEQGAFQKGNIISANIGLASELANLLHTSVRGGGMGIKVDVQKAYDTLSWNFLFAVLKKFGFSNVWLSWNHEILISSRISILFNGGPVGFFGVERGLRQEDPISPMLFILAEEVLCRGLNGLLKEGENKGSPWAERGYGS
ncbi:secreted RxLR effector protein 78-like [Macadamia integrifolia]|uniref:secreted RxLR effector protein 78-like n=1 Tax=Macadamia integrifolia TaxID=60698 RepID=UPI001C4E6849|nr:secreted RxLR effector protein 78-like [Macadamia integrifolia]